MSDGQNDQFEAADLRIDSAHSRAHYNGNTIYLTPLLCSILNCIHSETPHYVGRETIIRVAWAQKAIEGSTFDQARIRLDRLLLPHGLEIENAPRMGFRLKSARRPHRSAPGERQSSGGADTGRNSFQLPTHVYIHFLDIYHSFRAIYDNGVSRDRVWREGRRAFRLAFLCSNNLSIPASSYFESELARWVLAEHVVLSEMGVVSLTSGHDSLDKQRNSKLNQYGPYSPEHLRHAYESVPQCPPPPYIQREGSSLRLIQAFWMEYLESGRLRSRLEKLAPSVDMKAFDHAWTSIPTELGDRAFTPDHVASIMAAMGFHDVPRVVLAESIEGPYVRGYPNDIGAVVVSDLNYLASPFALGEDLAVLSYRSLCIGLSSVGLLGLIDNCDTNLLLSLRLVKELRELCQLMNAAPVLNEQSWLLATKCKRAIRQLLKNQKQHDPRGFVILAPERRQSTDPLVGIITALPVEFVAMKQLLSESYSRHIKDDPNRYLMGFIRGDSPDEAQSDKHTTRLPVVLTRLRRAGTNSAASSATNLLRSFPSVQVVVMTGIACAVPNPEVPAKDVRLGDVVVSDHRGVVQFDHVTRSNGLDSLKSALPPPSSRLVDALNELEVNEYQNVKPWLNYIREIIDKIPSFARPDEDKLGESAEADAEMASAPRIFRGVIGSSNTLLRDEEYRNYLRDHYGLMAIEMEGSGIAEATWNFDKFYFVIRGTCDYGDNTKGDTWHRYASAIAAAYTRALLDVY